MELNDIKQILDEALQNVCEKDRYLLEHDINEQAISHRLALYLESNFSDFNVDCEYNGNIDADRGRKYIILLKKKAFDLGKLKEGEEEHDLLVRNVYPDIIIHKRGYNGIENNLLIIEVKKSSNQDKGDWDEEKLLRFTCSDHGNQFNYQYGVFVRFVVGKEPGYFTKWYHDGQSL